jgi:hypothetical protein
LRASRSSRPCDASSWSRNPSTLIATLRSSMASCARKTTPHASAPELALNSILAETDAGVKGMDFKAGTTEMAAPGCGVSVECPAFYPLIDS